MTDPSKPRAKPRAQYIIKWPLNKQSHKNIQQKAEIILSRLPPPISRHGDDSQVARFNGRQKRGKGVECSSAMVSESGVQSFPLGVHRKRPRRPVNASVFAAESGVSTVPKRTDLAV